MEKEFIPYEQALDLKELGFDEDGLGTYSVSGQVLPLKPYTTESKAILFSQAFRWFREKYDLECHIKSLCEQSENKGFYFGIDDYANRDFYSKPYYSYEEAELECLKKLIEIVKEK